MSEKTEKSDKNKKEKKYGENAIVNLPPLQFDQVLDLRHCCESYHDAYRQRRDSPY